MHDQVTAAIEAERAAWNALVDEVGEGRMEEAGPMSAWTFKDLASHITGWRSFYIAQIEAGSRGDANPPPPWPAALTTDDEINAWLHDRDHERPVADVLADADAAFPRLQAAIEAVSVTDLADPDRFPWTYGKALGEAIVSGGFFAHLHEGHEPDVRAWLREREADPATAR